ncbi:MAG: nucleoside-diphosphate-sugar pyrophosphorylase, partial [Verrucomicrobia bacterium]
MAAISQAFVLAAGLGKRLRPLTDDLPKPLIPIFQKPLITFVLDHLINAGVNRF